MERQSATALPRFRVLRFVLHRLVSPLRQSPRPRSVARFPAVALAISGLPPTHCPLSGARPFAAPRRPIRCPVSAVWTPFRPPDVLCSKFTIFRLRPLDAPSECAMVRPDIWGGREMVRLQHTALIVFLGAFASGVATGGAVVRLVLDFLAQSPPPPPPPPPNRLTSFQASRVRYARRRASTAAWPFTALARSQRPLQRPPPAFPRNLVAVKGRSV